MHPVTFFLYHLLCFLFFIFFFLSTSQALVKSTNTYFINLTSTSNPQMLPVHSALNWPLECFESSSWHEITLTSLPLTAPAGPRKLIDFESRNSKSICEWPLSISITESESILTIKSYVPLWKLLLYHIVMPTFFSNSLYIISKWFATCAEVGNKYSCIKLWMYLSSLFLIMARDLSG